MRKIRESLESSPAASKVERTITPGSAPQPEIETRVRNRDGDDFFTSRFRRCTSRPVVRLNNFQTFQLQAAVASASLLSAKREVRHDRPSISSSPIAPAYTNPTQDSPRLYSGATKCNQMQPPRKTRFSPAHFHTLNHPRNGRKNARQNPRFTRTNPRKTLTFPSCNDCERHP